MPRFFFDTDADTYLVDEIGKDLPDREAARAHALDIVPNRLRAAMGVGVCCAVTVRDDAGEPFFRATLSLRCRDLD